MMDTAHHCLAVRYDVGFATFGQFTNSQDYRHMLGSNSRLWETNRKGILESFKNRFNLNCRATGYSKDPDIGK